MELKELEPELKKKSAETEELMATLEVDQAKANEVYGMHVLHSETATLRTCAYGESHIVALGACYGEEGGVSG